ncbi:MAG TPA: hypothetical protein PLF81_12605 [Candidatus Anammoximicrobium sp.]|nr:hypothetical protein [Candidatus Anammoximicrobium sp.]
MLEQLRLAEPALRGIPQQHPKLVPGNHVVTQRIQEFQNCRIADPHTQLFRLSRQDHRLDQILFGVRAGDTRVDDSAADRGDPEALGLALGLDRLLDEKVQKTDDQVMRLPHRPQIAVIKLAVFPCHHGLFRSRPPCTRLVPDNVIAHDEGEHD